MQRMGGDLTLYLLRHGEGAANVGRVFAARETRNMKAGFARAPGVSASRAHSTLSAPIRRLKIASRSKRRLDAGRARCGHGPRLCALRRAVRVGLEGVAGKRQERVLVVVHCLLFMAVIWLFCRNHGPTFEDGHMGRGRLSVIARSGEGLRLVEFDVTPDTPLRRSLDAHRRRS